jgi:hypothetical protein
VNADRTHALREAVSRLLMPTMNVIRDVRDGESRVLNRIHGRSIEPTEQAELARNVLLLESAISKIEAGIETLCVVAGLPEPAWPESTEERV